MNPDAIPTLIGHATFVALVLTVVVYFVFKKKQT
jgi:hypothetical protein